MRSRIHRPWQPRMGDDHLFNPFIRSTDPGVTLDDTRELADVEAEEEVAAQERAQEPSTAEPAKPV